MKIRVLEIVVIALLFFGVLFNHTLADNYTTFIAIRLTLIFIYAIGGYFIFKPAKEIKFGIGISIINGLLLSIVVFLTTTVISSGEMQNYAILLSMITPVFVIIGGLILLLYFKNRKLPENRSYVRSTIYRNVILFAVCFIVCVLPNKARVIIFHGTSSFQYYEVKQYECLEESDTYIESENYEAAISKALEAIKYSEQREDTADYLFQKSLNSLGYAYYRNGNYKKADSAFNKVVLINKADAFSIHSSDYNNTLYYCGLLYSSWGYYTKSDSMFNEFLLYGDPSDLSRAYINECFGDNHKGRGDLIKADSLYKAALLKHVQNNYENKSSYINVLIKIANNYSERALYEKADSTFNIALNETKKEFGDSGMEYAKLVDDIISLNIITGQYKKAKELCEITLKIKAAVVGKENSEYLYTLLKKVTIQMTLSEYDGIENTLFGCLSVIKQRYNEKSPLACSVYDNLTELYKDYDQITTAEIYADRSLEAREDYYGNFNINTAHSLDNKAFIYYWKNMPDEAEDLYFKSLSIKRDYAGRNNPSYANSLNGLGLVTTAKNNLPKADTIFNYALEILENTVGKNHPGYATALNNKGYLKIKEGKFDLAENCIQESLNINTALFGNFNLNIAENYIAFAVLKKQQKLYKESLINYRKALDVYEKIFKQNHLKIIQAKNEIILLEKIK